MLSWKIAPALAARQHRRAQAGRDHAADRAAVRRGLPAGRPAAGRRQHPHRRRRDRARLVAHDGVDKVAFTGSTEVGKEIARTIAGTRKRAHARARRQGRQHRLRRRADRPGGRGHRQRHLLQPGPRLLRRVAAAGAGERRRGGRTTGSSGGCRRCASATRWTRTPTSARSTPPSSWTGSASCPRSARPRAPTRWTAPCDLPDRGFWFAPTVFTGVSQTHRIAQEEIFGPVLSVLTFRTPQEAVAKANNTPYGLSAGVWTEKGSRILWMADQLRAGVVWANTFNRFDPTSPVRRVQGVRVRPRGRPARTGGLRHDRSRPMSPSPAPEAPHRGPQDLQAVHRRRLPPQRVRPDLRGRPTPRAGSSRTPR